MAHFLLQGSYSADAWKAMVNKPENRIEVVRPVIESLGGKVEAGYFCFGEYDIFLVVELPDNVSAAAFSVAIAAGGAFTTQKTTILLSSEEAMDAMKKGAGLSGYRAPGK